MRNKVDVNKVECSIEMIKNYVTEVDTTSVISILEAIVKQPDDGALIVQLSESLQPLGISQGAVLNYAPYIAVLISFNLFEE